MQIYIILPARVFVFNPLDFKTLNWFTLTTFDGGKHGKGQLYSSGTVYEI